MLAPRAALPALPAAAGAAGGAGVGSIALGWSSALPVASRHATSASASKAHRIFVMPDYGCTARSTRQHRETAITDRLAM